MTRLFIIDWRACVCAYVRECVRAFVLARDIKTISIISAPPDMSGYVHTGVPSHACAKKEVKTVT
jgi:hypothetical protein